MLSVVSEIILLFKKMTKTKDQKMKLKGGDKYHGDPLEQLVVKMDKKYYASWYVIFLNDNIQLLREVHKLRKEIDQLGIVHRRKIFNIKKSLRKTVDKIEND